MSVYLMFYLIIPNPFFFNHILNIIWYLQLEIGRTMTLILMFFRLRLQNQGCRLPCWCVTLRQETCLWTLTPRFWHWSVRQSVWLVLAWRSLLLLGLYEQNKESSRITIMLFRYIMPYYGLFSRDLYIFDLRWRSPLCSLLALLLCSMTHYNITMGHDVARNAWLWHNNG